jgi:hypothetical protein
MTQCRIPYSDIERNAVHSLYLIYYSHRDTPKPEKKIQLTRSAAVGSTIHTYIFRADKPTANSPYFRRMGNQGELAGISRCMVLSNPM